MKGITPIILIGMNRTGTKWLSNILCGHMDVIGAQSERSTGILETNMFGAMQDKFDLSRSSEYIGFLELWAQTEAFRRTGIDKEAFYALSPRPRSFLTLFDILMSEFALKNGKRYWLQKTSPLRAVAVLEHFDNAKIVLVRRNLFDTLKSTWGLQMRRYGTRQIRRYGARRMVRSVYAYVYQRKIMDRIARKHRVVEVEYDVLKEHTSEEASRVCRELGLDPAKMTLTTSYAKNTSFESDQQREAIMSASVSKLVRVAALAVDLVPLSVMTLSATLKAKLVGRRPIALMSGTFGDLVDKLADQSDG